MQRKSLIIIFLLISILFFYIDIPESKGQVAENHYLRDRPNGFCGASTQEQLVKAIGGGDVTNTLLIVPDLSHSENITATLSNQVGAEWFASLHIETPTGGGPGNTVRALVTRQNISCSTTYTMIDITLTVNKGTTEQYVFTNGTSQPALLFNIGDSLVLEVFRVAGNQVPILHYNSTTNDSLVSTTIEQGPPGNDPVEVRRLHPYTLNTPLRITLPRFETIGCIASFLVGCVQDGLFGRDTIFQDMEIRLNITVRDADGIENLTSIHINFNATDTINVTISWYNDPNASPDQFLANTTQPTIIENLRMENNTEISTHNITLIFSFSDEMGQGFHTLWSVNASDGTSSDVNLQTEKWIMFFREPSDTVVAGGTGTSGLFPLAPLLQLFFIVGGFWFILGAKGRIELQATGLFFFLASMLFIISPIYAVIDSNDNLSYVILNYPDAIRNNFVLINLTILGLGLTNVIINNRQRVGL